MKQHTIELGGKQYPVRFTKGSLSKTEFELGQSLIGPGAVEFWDKLQGRTGETPEQSIERLATTPGNHYRIAVLVYAGIGGALKFEQVLELTDISHYVDVFQAVLDFFRSLGLVTETTETQSQPPRPANNSGSASGPLPASKSASPAPSSGTSRRASSRRSPIAIVNANG